MSEMVYFQIFHDMEELLEAYDDAQRGRILTMPEIGLKLFCMLTQMVFLKNWKFHLKYKRKS